MSSFARRAASAIHASQACHVKLFPRPTGIRDTKEALRVCNRFGDVVLFWSLRDDPVGSTGGFQSAAVVVFRNSESAQRLIEASPVAFQVQPAPRTRDPPFVQFTQELGRLTRETEGNGRDRFTLPSAYAQPAVESVFHPDPANSTLMTPLQLQQSLPRPPSVPAPSHGSRLADSARDFQLIAEPSTKNLAPLISRQVFYWDYRSANRSFAEEHLKASTPLPSMALLRPPDIQTQPAHRVSKWKQQAWEPKWDGGLIGLWRKGLHDSGVGPQPVPEVAHRPQIKEVKERKPLEQNDDDDVLSWARDAA